MNKHNSYIFLIVSALLSLTAAPLLAQQTHNAGIQYGTGTPVYTPSNQGSRLYIDLVTGVRYNWNINTLAWQADAQGIMRTTGGTPPLAAPGYGQPGLALNYASPPELYVYVGPTGTDWLCLNCAEGVNLGEGSGIVITGTAPDITISAVDVSDENELNASFEVDGSDLVLTDSGGALSVPVASIAPVQAVNVGTGLSVSGTSTRTITNTAPDQTVALTGTGITVGGTYPTFTLTAADQSATNELQTLSISGQDLTLSNGGGTVEIPGVTWPLLAPDGSDAEPSYSFENSPGSGLWLDDGSDNLTLSGKSGTRPDNIIISAGASPDLGGGTVRINGGNSDVDAGGSFELYAGSGINGGNFGLNGGDATTGAGGGFTARAGNGNVGGVFQLEAGDSGEDELGGNLNLLGGDGGAGGGQIYIAGGNSATAAGANVALAAGAGATDALNGQIIITGNGVLFPGLTTTQRNNISILSGGLVIFNTTTSKLQVYTGSAWVDLH